MHVSFLHYVVMLLHFSPLLRSTMQFFLWKRQVCPEFINVIIENNLSHESGDKSTLCNVAMKVFPLSSRICICTWPFCFARTWCPSATSMYLSVSSNDPEMKPETSGVMWQVATESIIQLVNCELSPYFSLERSSLLEIRSIDMYILWSSLFSPLLHARLKFSLKRTCFRRLSLSFGGLGNFAIMWSSDPHLNHFRGGHSICLWDETSTARDFSFSFLTLLKHFLQNDCYRHKMCTLSEHHVLLHYSY